mgnify:CR=1 FL=1
MKQKRKVSNIIWITVLTVASLLWIYPIVMILFNSLKKETAISTSTAFTLPTADTFAGISNYVSSLTSQGFLKSLGYSTLITVTSVAAILLCCSMCAWCITRLNGVFSKIIYYMCVLSMVVPFQMVMFTLAKTADALKLNNPYNICIIYLGFGAGLVVFMFCGFMRSVPVEIEEAAMIDGCSPIQTYFQVVFPILKPTAITVAILQVMWIWNDYLLPYLVLDIRKWKTIPIAIQYLKGGYGSIDWGAMMAMLVLAILPIIIFYGICQKYIIEGVVAGAVKG